ncbi:MAG: Asp-tRNA(Asn)/Glu-tRNA(Gln) amidotransferase subunit GatB [Planctomycetota bacterium]
MTSKRRYEAVIGLEVHVQLQTETKLFCACRNEYGAEPNTNVCEVCTGQPGVLPVLNERALELAVKAGLALGCEIADWTRFDRKSYFYPDLPKGYQISQFDRPINGRGGIEIEGDDGQPRRIAITRAHLEEDAGKTIHPEGKTFSLVDLNRTGIPLLEIVSDPELRSPAEAYRYLVALKRILRFAQVSTCDMEKGSLRCDANISVRPSHDENLGTRTEIKNLNSFRNVERALAYEIERQITVLAEGGQIVQETRTWLEQEERTHGLRSKEESRDYRYFPDPDLVAIPIAKEWVDKILDTLPEMPAGRLRRYVDELGLTQKAAAVLASEPETSDFFERCVARGKAQPAEVGKFISGPLLRLAKDTGVPVDQLSITPRNLVKLVRMVQNGELSGQAARKVLPAMAESGASPSDVVKELGLAQLSDPKELASIIEKVIASSEKGVTAYRHGKKAALNSLIGKVMKMTKGKANPNLVKKLLQEQLGG